MSKIIYKPNNTLEFISFLFWGLLCIVAIIYFACHYRENPPVIIAAIIIACFFLMIIGYEEMTVYSDRIIVAYPCILTILRKTKERVYEIKNIKAASLPDTKSPAMMEWGIVALLTVFLPTRSYRNPHHYFFLDFKDETFVRISSSLKKQQLKKIVNTINSLIE